MDLQRTLLKDVILPKLKSVYVIDYYEGMRGMLESRADFPYKDMFANPRIRTRNDIIWSSDAFSNRPVKLAELGGEDRKYYSYLLYKEITAVRHLIATLKEEDGGMPLSDLLSKALSNIDDSSVYCGDDKIVLVNWGVVPRQSSPDGFGGIYRSGKFLGGWDSTHRENPKLLVPDNDSEVQNEEAPDPHDSETASDETEETAGTMQSEDSAPEPTDKTPETGVNGEVMPEAVSEDGVLPETTDVADKLTSKDPEGKKDTEKKEEKPKDDKKAIDKKETPYGWKDLFRDFWKGVRFLFRKLWRILLLALLVLLGLFVFRNCHGQLSQVNPFFNPLPERPVIMPVDDGSVGLSEDSIYSVATDRLNILLEKEDDNTMLEWAKAFKKAYPSSDYEIKYYKEDTYMLQIKVPANQRIKVLNELNSKLPDFSFDVFEETVYNAGFTSNDPGLSDGQASWYIDAIGARTAWDLTQGSEEVVVAVVDNGFDLSHPELAGKIVGAYNVLSQDDRVSPVGAEEGARAHGTHVAATAVGNSGNGSGLLGIAPNCRLMPVQVGSMNRDGSISNTAVMEGVMYAINNGADVINISLGLSMTPAQKAMSEAQQLNFIFNSFRHEEAMWARIFSKARERNCIIVFAAGNDNMIAGVDPHNRDAGVLKVSATDPHMSKASFSNYGRYPDLDRYYSTVSASGVSIYSAAPDGKYIYLQGTSMAAPVVTGAIALLKSVDRDITAEQAISLLQRTGIPVDPSVGPMIHIGKALYEFKYAAPAEPLIDCDRIREKVGQLQAQIDSLQKICPEAAAQPDTLMYKDVIEDPRSLDGTWKSTAGIVSMDDNSPVELYMTFNNMKGQLIAVNKGNEFVASLQASIVNDQIYITQSGPAISSTTQQSFMPYTYQCSADRKGYLSCTATSVANRLCFNLVRISEIKK